MHPVMLDQVARDHVRTLVHEAEGARLARSTQNATRHGLRRRLGLRLIAAGERLATDCPQSVAHLHGGRV